MRQDLEFGNDQAKPAVAAMIIGPHTAITMNAKDISLQLHELDRLITSEPVGVRFSGRSRATIIHLHQCIDVLADQRDFDLKQNRSLISKTLGAADNVRTSLRFIFGNKTNIASIDKLIRSITTLIHSLMELCYVGERERAGQPAPISSEELNDTLGPTSEDCVLTATSADPEEIWVESDIKDEPVRYVRADLFDAAQSKAAILELEVSILKKIQQDALARTNSMVEQLQGASQQPNSTTSTPTEK
jgi:hypothetical protein